MDRHRVRFSSACLSPFTAAVIPWGLVAGLLLCTAYLAFHVRIIRVEGTSMSPTLLDGEYLLGWRTQYSDDHYLAPGQIVIGLDPADSRRVLVKRILSLGSGHLAELHWGLNAGSADGAVLSQRGVGDICLPEIWTDERLRRTIARYISGRFLRIPRNTVFLVGDNPSASRDSRQFGPVPVNSIVALPVIRIWSTERWPHTTKARWGRIGTVLSFLRKPRARGSE